MLNLEFEFSERSAEESGDLWRSWWERETEAHCMVQIAKEQIQRIACCFPRRRSFCLLPKQMIDLIVPRGRSQAPLVQRRPRYSDHGDDRYQRDLFHSRAGIKYSRTSRYQKVLERRPLGRPEGLTLTVHWQNSKSWSRNSKSEPPPLPQA